MLDGKPAESYDPVPALERARTQTMPPMFRATRAKRALEPAPVSPEHLRSLQPIDGIAGQSPQWAVNRAGDAIRALALSADASVCALGTDSFTHGVVRLEKLDADPRGKPDAPRQKRQFVQQIALTPDGRYLVAATTEPPAVFVQDAAGKEIWSKTDIPFNWGTDPRWMRDEPDYFALAPHGDRVVVRENAQRLVCYETATGKQLWERSYAGADARIWRDAHRLRFSDDGKHLVVSTVSYLTDEESATKLGKIATEKLDAGLKALDSEARHRLLSLNPDTGEIAWARTQRTVPVAVSVPRGHPFFPLISPRPDLDVRRLFVQPRIPGYYLSVSRDGSRIAAGDELGYQSIYSGDGEALASYAVAGRPCLSPDGATLAVYHDAIVLIDLTDGRQLTLPLRGREEISDVAWSTDNGRLAVARWDGTIQVIDKSSEKTLGSFEAAQGVGSILLPMSSGGWLAGTSDGQLLRIDDAGAPLRHK
jgi:outer membrane protein assembly factor BamB